MKVKNLTNKIRKVVCALLTVAMVCTNTGMAVFAEESTQAEETQQEFRVEETQEPESDEKEFGEEDAEIVLEEDDSAEKNTVEEHTNDEDMKKTSTEEMLTEETISEVVSTEDTADAEETEVSENELKLTFSATDIDHGAYTENGNNITWVIDAEGKLTVEGTGDFAPRGYAAARAPWYAHRMDIKTAEINVKGMTDAQCMFSGCSELTDINLDGFDTSSVTSMFDMFSGCSSLESVDVSKFDTSSVTYMGSMFGGCSSLKSVDVSKFDTSSVTTGMRMMFYDCSSLTELNVSNFNTDSVTDMLGMFQGCSSLTELNVSNFNTDSVTNMSQMFYGCSSLTELNVSNFDTDSVTDMGGMFRDCSSLTKLDVSSFNTDSVMNMRCMFINCSKLTGLNLKHFDTRHVMDMRQMFQNCSSLTSLDLSTFNSEKVTDMYCMFYDCSSLTSLDLGTFNSGKVTNMERMFDGCSNLTSLDLSGFNASSVTELSGIFGGCNKLKTIYTPYNLKQSVSLPSGNWYQHYDADEEEDVEKFRVTSLPEDLDHSLLLVKLGNGEKPDALVPHLEAVMAKTIYEYGDDLDLEGISVKFYWSDGTVKIITDYTTNADELNMYEVGDKNLIVRLNDMTDTIKVTVLPELEGDDIAAGSYAGITWSISAAGKLTVTGTGDFSAESSSQRAPWYAYRFRIKSAEINVRDMTDASYMFCDCNNLKRVDFSNFKTDKVTSMKGMFYNCNRIKGLGLGGFETAAVTNMRYMFYNCSNLTELNLKNFITENVTDMYGMFYGCSGLTSLDLSGFDTSNVTTMYYMFIDCSSLISLDLSNFNTAAVTNMGGMFNGCSSLTSLDLSNFNTAAVTNMYQMFSGCSSLTSLDVSRFDTANVTKMEWMFNGCSSLTNLDLRNFNTAAVTNMQYMFQSCSGLTSLDVSRFDTRNVTDMSEMFFACSSLTSLDVSSFDTRNVTDMSKMFSWCSSLTNLDLSSFDTAKVTSMDSVLLRCDALKEIYTPYNVSVSAELPSGTWYDAEENTYTALPTGRTESVALAKGAKPSVTEYITAVKAKTVYNCGDTINTDDLRVTYYGSDGSVRQLTAAEYGTNASEINTRTAGDKTLIVTYKDKNLKAEITLTVKEKQEGGETEESSKTDESSSTGESSSTEGSDSEESSTTESSDTADKDDSLYEDNERTALNSVSGDIAKIKDKVYDGNAYEPVVKVTTTVNGKKTTLTEGADYRVLYKNNVNAGTGTVTVKGNGEYKGDIVKTFTISPKSVKKLKVITGGITANTTVGDLSTLPVYVYDGTKQLKYNTDYTLSSYNYDEKKKTAVVTVTGKGNYDEKTSVVAKIAVYATGDAEKLIKPENVNLKVEGKAVTNDGVPYTGKAIKPDVEVKINTTPLDKKNYKVQYQNNKDAGTAYVIVTGKGEYKGKAVVPFTIKAETAENPENAFTIKDIKAKTYNGKLQKPSVSVTIKKDGKDKKLSKKDYTVSYTNNLHAGTATITVIGKGNYASLRAKKDFTINPLQIKKASLKGTKGNLELYYNKKKLVKGKDYKEPEYGTENKGKVPVTIKGDGDFTGEMTKTVKVQ